MNTRARALGATVMICLTVSGCATNGLSSLPLPHPGMGKGGYAVNAVFSNALNLPTFAKVRLGGVDVGQLESLTAQDYTAVARLRIRDGVQLPKGTRVELRSATPLGDVFIALKPPSPDAPNPTLLNDGDTIGVEQTTAAATVENLLTGAAVLVNGGSVQSLTNLINGAGKAAAGSGGHNFAHVVDTTNQLLGKLNSRTDQIADSLTALSTMAQRVEAKNDVIAHLMAAAAPATDTLAQQTTRVADLVVQGGNTTAMLNRFPSVAGTDASGRSMIADLNTMSAALNDVVLDPDADLGSLNRLIPPLVKATPGDGLSVRIGIDRLILGSIPDIGFPGSQGLHGPKWSNFNQIIGSFKYILFRLQERMVGRGPNVAQVPVIPGPQEQWQVNGPVPGPTEPGQFVTPANPAPALPGESPP